MHRILAFSLSLSAALALAPPLEADPLVVVSAGSELAVYALDEEAGSLERRWSSEVGTAGVLALSPGRDRLYLSTGGAPPKARGKGKPGPALATFAVTADGTLTPLASAPASMSTGYLMADARGKFLAGSNYPLGQVATWKLDGEGVYRGEEARVFLLEQKAHSARFSPDNRFLFVPATGPEQDLPARLRSRQRRHRPQPAFLCTGSTGADEAKQPRHLIFHPKLPVAYTTLEREFPGVGTWNYAPERGLLTLAATHLSVPVGSEGMTTADLHLSPDARFLYVSNRDIAGRKNPTGDDSIALFAVDPDDGALSFVKRFPCERVPRSFALSPSGRTVLVGGQGDSVLGIYAASEKNGHLTRRGGIDLPGGARWVSCFAAPL